MTAEARPTDRIRMLGAEMDVVTPAQTLDFAARAIAEGRSTVVANHNTHSLYLLPRTPGLKAFFDIADIVQVDSTPMIAWGRLLGLPIGGQHRSTYLDWREDFWRLADARGWRVFYLGGAPGVAEGASARLGQRWPGVTLGFRDGYFDAAPGGAGNEAVLAQIAAFAPDILFVGMGMPRQELWIVQNRTCLARGVIFSVGAAYDYEAGAQVAAPRWTGRFGLEWLFRLISQPRRLAFRYLVEPWALIPHALADVGAALSRARRRPQAPSPAHAGG